jgi:glycerol-3-phosphate acyltransferase PlsY
MLKGVTAVVIARHCSSLPVGYAETLFVLAVVGGHCWSLIIKYISGRFRGGSGVAAAFGGLWLVSPVSAFLSLLGNALVVAKTKYVSLGTLVAMGVALLGVAVEVMAGSLDPKYIIYPLVLDLFLLFMHKKNIIMLIAGNERKVGEVA